MFIREYKNRSGSISIQIVRKENGRSKVLKTIGYATTRPEIEALKIRAQQEMDLLKQQLSLIYFDRDEQLLQSITQLKNNQIQIIGPELIFGRIYNHIGFNQITDDLFRHLVLAWLAFPLSKLKTIDYLRRYQNVDIHVDKIYRFLDKLEDKLKPQVEQISFFHTKRIHSKKQGNLRRICIRYRLSYLHRNSEERFCWVWMRNSKNHWIFAVSTFRVCRCGKQEKVWFHDYHE